MLPPMPSAGSSAPQPMASPSPQPGNQMSGLLGPSQPPAASQPAPNVQQMSEAFMMEVRDLTMRIDGLARQCPACGEDLEIAKQALINAMTKALMGLSSTEPQGAPSLVG